MSAKLRNGVHIQPSIHTIPLRTMSSGYNAHITIREIADARQGGIVDCLTVAEDNDILVDLSIPSLWTETGMYTFEVTARVSDEHCLFSFSLTQWLDGYIR